MYECEPVRNFDDMVGKWMVLFPADTLSIRGTILCTSLTSKPACRTSSIGRLPIRWRRRAR